MHRDREVKFVQRKKKSFLFHSFYDLHGSYLIWGIYILNVILMVCYGNGNVRIEYAKIIGKERFGQDLFVDRIQEVIPHANHFSGKCQADSLIHQ